jgi:molybdopterin/thiamine biosynthesis adenylyltransferase
MVDRTRHSGLFNACGTFITLIGAGGIGAFAALALAKMGVDTIEVYDDDVVSDANIATQLHKISDVGTPKVEALREAVHEYADDVAVLPVPARVGEYTRLNGSSIVVSAVDSIAARKAIWEAVQRSGVRWYIDARMAAEELHLFVVDLAGDTLPYCTMLAVQDDASVPDLPCTEKATVFCGMVAGGMIASVVRKIVSGLPVPKVFSFDMRANFVFNLNHGA